MVLPVCLLATFLTGTSPFILKDIVGPSKLTIGSTAILSCELELNGDELESLKWYKDEDQLCEIIPKNSTQPVVKINAEFENVSCENSSLRLGPVSLSARGTYKCEATSRPQPHVQSVMASRNLSVFAYPMDPPVISGLKPAYRRGEYIEASCTAPPSFPAPTLYWTINNQHVNPHQTYSKSTDEKGLLRALIGLKMLADSSYFETPEGYALLVCTSVLMESSPMSSSKKLYFSSDPSQPPGLDEGVNRKRLAPQSKGSSRAVHLVTIFITFFSLVCHFSM